jgi:hypothetical protein
MTDISTLTRQGQRVTAKAHGGPIDIEGVTVAHLNDAMKVTKLETWFDPVEMFRQIPPNSTVKENIASQGCPVLHQRPSVGAEEGEAAAEA